MTDEFSLIERYFAPLSDFIGDDCAILDYTPGERLAVSTDTQVCGTHFPLDAPPDQLAYRALVAAVSDLAAMGAVPRGVTLALTLPEIDHTFMQQFSRGLEQALADYQLSLLGGDTTSGPLAITITVLGALPADAALLRSGARPGDKVYISGTPGDAAAALTVIDGRWPGRGQHKEFLLRRYYRPTARIELGRQLLGRASSAIDVSDGLLADAGHICTESGVGMHIDSARIPLSPALASVPDVETALEWALAGGDDYELLFTGPPGLDTDLPVHCTCIGEVIPGEGVSCDIDIGSTGYKHFEAAASDAVPDVHAPPLEPRPVKPRPFRSVTQFFAFGMGSGLSPKAPGTVGTLAAIPLYLLVAPLGLPIYSALLLLAVLAGTYLCDAASRELKVHDHPGIVWDEFAGFWITMWAVPLSWQTLLAGFLLFRLFDIAKPWPISALDKKVGGGFGIMVDDVLAGMISCVLLHMGWYLFNGTWPLS